MTEKEAKTRWCPMVRRNVGWNRDMMHGKVDDGCFCIASDCMMWRWECKEIKREDHSGGRELIYEEAAKRGTSPRREVGSFGMWIVDALGHCGMAGMP